MLRHIAIYGFAFASLATIAAVAQDATGPDLSLVAGSVKTLTAGRPETRIPFPAIADWSTLRIGLERRPCFGRCPAYKVEIDGRGTVTYLGENFVAAEGVRTAHISERAVRRLYDLFVKADFFWTFDEYESRVTDFPTYLVTISFDGHAKRVRDYAGTSVGMPKEIVDLEESIDAVAGTKKWVEGERSP